MKRATTTRRFFLKSGGIALAGVGSGLFNLPGFLTRAAETAPRSGKTLVVVFQRGAADGLNIVVPHGDKAYYALRPTIAIPRPRRDSTAATAAALDLDGSFGLHPALAPLKKLYDAQQLAVIHAAGSPDATRSHFDAQDFMEAGTPGVKSTADGFLNRYLQAHAQLPGAPAHDGTAGSSTFRAVTSTTALPRMLHGPAPVLAIPALSRFGLEQGRFEALAARGLRSLYEASDDPLLAPTARETFEALEFIERTGASRYEPADGAVYPDESFGRGLSQIAQLIKANVGLEIAYVDLGGWDHHVQQGGVEGRLARLLSRFARGIEAFARDLGDRLDDVVLVSMSEFGRTARENGNRGTDHGHANAMFVLGGKVKGGRIYGAWPGLELEQLHDGRDLALTTDYRDVIAELLSDHLGATDLGPVFPGHGIKKKNFKHLI